MLTLDLPGFRKLRSGKVREVFELPGDPDHLLFVATDRLSAFDVVMRDPIPDKGRVLTRLSAWWFERLRAEGIENHFVTMDVATRFPALEPHAKELAGRAMIVERTEPLPVECVARGWLAGGGWKDYGDTGFVSGVELPKGLRLAEKLPAPIFTPARKAEQGHDENISFELAAQTIGRPEISLMRDLTLGLYARAADLAAERGILIADTKFEFGRRADGSLILIDEVLTPDSSRFWPADQHQVGSSPPSFDKQFVRDWLETQDWDKTPPAPPLPAEVIEGTRARYVEAYERLTGEKFDAR